MYVLPNSGPPFYLSIYSIVATRPELIRFIFRGLKPPATVNSPLRGWDYYIGHGGAAFRLHLICPLCGWFIIFGHAAAPSWYITRRYAADYSNSSHHGPVIPLAATRLSLEILKRVALDDFRSLTDSGCPTRKRELHQQRSRDFWLVDDHRARL